MPGGTAGWIASSDLKYFNVFGPNENHKGEMRSVVHKSFDQIKESGVIRLFKSYRPEYRDGEQKRDFLYVKDAVAMTLHLAANRTRTESSISVPDMPAPGTTWPGPSSPRWDERRASSTSKCRRTSANNISTSRKRTSESCAPPVMPADHSTRRRGARLRGELSAARKISRQRNRSFRCVRLPATAAKVMKGRLAHKTSRVLILISDVSVRCTGHLSAISSSLARCSAVKRARKPNVSFNLSSIPSRVSHSAQSSAWIFRWRSSTVTRCERPALSTGVHRHGHRSARP